MTKLKQTPRLCLVGGLFIGAANNTTSFLVEMFGRFAEMKSAGGVTRQVQYASGTGDDDYILFVGNEVERVDDIPVGMVACDIDGDSWRVVQSVDGLTEVTWQEAITWKWLDLSVPGRPCGEFAAKCPGDWNKSGLQTQRDFRTVSNHYSGPPKIDDIHLVDCDPSWPEKYERMKAGNSAFTGTRCCTAY